MAPGTLCMRTTVTSGSCLDATVLTGKVTGAAAPCMVSWMEPADASCCLCCAEVSLKDRCTSALCWPLRTGAQPATWSCRAGCSYIAAMAWLTTLRLLCVAAVLPVAGIACHGLNCLRARFLGRCSGSNQVHSVPPSSDGGWTPFPCHPKKRKKWSGTGQIAASHCWAKCIWPSKSLLPPCGTMPASSGPHKRCLNNSADSYAVLRQRVSRPATAMMLWPLHWAFLRAVPDSIFKKHRLITTSFTTIMHI